MPPAPRFSTESSLQGPRAVEILDEAISLLRQTPLATLSIYYLGALPSCLALIYFWFDMTQGTEAEAHLPGEALALTGLYFWMKTCQAVFARQLLALLEGEDAEAWTLERWLNMALLQVIAAGSFFIVYPVALVATIPFGWINAFYHNFSIVATGAKSTLGSSYREAAALAGLWPKQNHLVLGILLVATLVLYANLAVFCMMVPQLLNMLFGIETVFEDNTYAWNNSSFYLDVSVFCFLLLNPLNKAVYALRCFYGRARLNGADLKSALRRYQMAKPSRVAPALGALALLSLLAFAGSAPAETASATTPPKPEVKLDPSAATLDASIEKTLQKDEFAWRLPHATAPLPDETESWPLRTLRGVVHYFENLIRPVAKWLAEVLKWLFEIKPTHDPASTSGQGFGEIPWRLLFVIFALVVVLILVYWLAVHLRRQPPKVAAPLTPSAVRTVDLEAEDVQADQLPEDSWLSLAQQMIEKGELRLAVRAFYLATLCVLAAQQLVRLGPAKSNRDYLVELTRRLRGDGAALGFFRENVRLFEASWYGTHAATSAILETMRANHQQLRSHAAT
jgi:hypothetical protein